MLASADVNGKIKIWHYDGTLVQNLKGHQGEITDIKFSPDNQTLASASVDGKVKFWHVSGILLGILKHKSPVNSISFSPDGQRHREVTIKW